MYGGLPGLELGIWPLDTPQLCELYVRPLLLLWKGVPHAMNRFVPQDNVHTTVGTVASQFLRDSFADTVPVLVTEDADGVERLLDASGDACVLGLGVVLKPVPHFLWIVCM